MIKIISLVKALVYILLPAFRMSNNDTIIVLAGGLGAGSTYTNYRTSVNMNITLLAVEAILL